MNWPANGEGNEGDKRPETYTPDEQLTLTGDEDSLPWLASDDEDDEPEAEADYRILIFAVVALLALGGILWTAKGLLSGEEHGELVADGSTIEAPEGDYKERPANPGGEEVAGTGDLSYEVGEGISREGHVGGQGAASPPAADPAQAGTPTATASGTGASTTGSPVTGGVGVQVGAYQTRASAETGWSQLATRHEVLQGVSHRVIEGTAESGTVFRLQAVASDVAAAEALCRAIRSGGGDCQVKR
jgi:hypothetical protein